MSSSKRPDFIRATPKKGIIDGPQPEAALEGEIKSIEQDEGVDHQRLKAMQHKSNSIGEESKMAKYNTSVNYEQMEPFKKLTARKESKYFLKTEDKQIIMHN